MPFVVAVEDVSVEFSEKKFGIGILWNTMEYFGIL